MSEATRVPVTVLTGFLGAGKTTLLNRWLTAYGPGEAAVLVNEFGEVGIDGALLHAPERPMEELVDGCLCCVPYESLVESLARLATRSPRPGRLFVETSGLAEPGPVVESIQYGNLPKLLRLEAIVTVVDPTAPRFDEPTVREQLAFADRVILSRADLASPAQLDEARAQVARLSPLAQVSLARRGQIDDHADPASWLTSRLRELTSAPPHRHPTDAPHDHAADGPPGHAADGPHDHAAGAQPHRHGHADADSIVLGLPGPIDADRLAAWLDRLAQRLGESLFRVKGIVALPASPHRAIVQGAGAGFEVTTGAPWGGEPPVSRLVIIGRRLDRPSLTADFARCAAS